eukprot:Hpha_TRINITY_DN15987_c2_g8::TRINITY_DN15987_c2_g8_i1::g.72323::m.72323/K03667/hslU; ATP-dependent HslUV protease ATP-binding subunit HslU
MRRGCGVVGGAIRARLLTPARNFCRPALAVQAEVSREYVGSSPSLCEYYRLDQNGLLTVAEGGGGGEPPAGGPPAGGPPAGEPPAGEPPAPTGSGGEEGGGPQSSVPVDVEEVEELVDLDVEREILARSLTPAHIVDELNKYIIGQEAAKRAVAISLRNRWRRTNVEDEELRADIHPKNILMIGPTGVGKTEISRRMSKLTEAPFVKVEATKFSEVGFRGADVETIIDDLYNASRVCARKILRQKNVTRAQKAARQIVISKLVAGDKPEEVQKHMELLEQGELDDQEIEFTIHPAEEPPSRPRRRTRDPSDGFDPQDAMQLTYERRTRPKKMKATVKDALPMIEKDELDKMTNEQEVESHAIKLAENHGVVFIDEIDKIILHPGTTTSVNVGEGVQQDLLPLIEGSTVNVKGGPSIKTDNVLFICSGAFHLSKPSDMIAELQGRLPVRVELSSLTEGDFHRILTEPKFNIIRQNQELLRTEGVELIFTDDALKLIAKLTQEVNSEMQNIGARRLITVVEKIVEDVSYIAEDYKDKVVTIDTTYVEAKVAELRKDQDDVTRRIL